MYDKMTINRIPHKPGIYMYFNKAGEVIYVGKAKNLNRRVHQYFAPNRNKTVKTTALVSHIDSIDVIVVDNEVEALILECNLIKKHRPRYNIMLKDDKSYPYIKVTVNEAYPRMEKTRKFRKDGAKYFGPFTNAFAVTQTMEAVNKTYHLRRCKQKVSYGTRIGRPCLNYHMGLCLAPCTGKVSESRYHEDVEAVLALLGGHGDELTKKLTAEMEAAAENLDFETAAVKRDQLRGIAHVAERQKISANAAHDQDVIAYAGEGDTACVLVLNVRGGKLIGRDHRYLQGIDEASPEAILTEFVKQYYVGQRTIPGEMILSVALEPEEEGVILAWLSTVKGSRVTLTVPKKGQKTELLRMAEENAALTLKQVMLEKAHKEKHKKDRVDSLKTLLSLEGELHRIEGYDISNIAGTDNVGGMVVFEGGKPNKKAYRRFKIKAVEGQNDYGSMQEMVYRRIERGLAQQRERDLNQDDQGKIAQDQRVQAHAGSFLPFPEVMCIDGGKAHVDAVRAILAMYPELHIAVTGLVKDDHHHLRGLIYDGEEYPLVYGTPLCTFLSEISEEVHRYALDYHQTLRKKRMVASSLESVPGIGPKRREALMRHFGTLENIQQATLEELLAVPGMNRKAAEALGAWIVSEGEKT